VASLRAAVMLNGPELYVAGRQLVTGASADDTRTVWIGGATGAVSTTVDSGTLGDR
jgi:hypothetical protein